MPGDLTYAAAMRCKCGAGLAYEEGDYAWDCSAILTGTAIPSGQPGAVRHTDRLPFLIYSVRSEREPGADTTRPSKLWGTHRSRETRT